MADATLAPSYGVCLTYLIPLQSLKNFLSSQGDLRSSELGWTVARILELSREMTPDYFTLSCYFTSSSVLPPPPWDAPASSNTRLFLVSSSARSQPCCRGGRSSPSHLFIPGSPVYKPTSTHKLLGGKREGSGELVTSAWAMWIQSTALPRVTTDPTVLKVSKEMLLASRATA